GSEIDLQSVAGDDVETAFGDGGKFAQRRQAARVAFDGDHLRGALGEERAGQAAGSGADLDDADSVERPGRAGDAPGQVEVKQKILAERSFRGEIIGSDDVAQRWQVVDGA